ncbi:MAG: hypothetical protein HC850_07125 [Rhodomicrobium sp.]|nr:hypothetical protein [Rhodomicrobium sp.]
MSALANMIAGSNFAERIFTDRQLRDIICGSDARRYGLVNRALKDGSLIRLKRGLYILSHQHRRGEIHPFVAAQAILPGSYVSFETALAHYRLIPEAVSITASVTPQRKSVSYQAPPFGEFTYHPLAIADYQFMACVRRAELAGQVAFVASPLRAIMDVVAQRKIEWDGLGWLTSGMRIDEEGLLSFVAEDFEALRPVYKHRAARAFLTAMQEALCGPISHQEYAA